MIIDTATNDAVIEWWVFRSMLPRGKQGIEVSWYARQGANLRQEASGVPVPIPILEKVWKSGCR